MTSGRLREVADRSGAGLADAIYALKSDEYPDLAVLNAMPVDALLRTYSRLTGKSTPEELLQPIIEPQDTPTT